MKDTRNIQKELETLEIELRNLEYTLQKITTRKVEVLTKIHDLKNNLKTKL
jgi:hypothetical protein